MRRLPDESELIPFASGFPPGMTWLVLAPHPDDETLGPGSTLALAAARGVRVHTVCVTSGGAQGDGEEREREAMAAAAALAIPEPSFWRLPDRGLSRAVPSLVARIRDALSANQIETVLMPSPIELHPDHRAVALAVQRAVRRHLLWGLRKGNPSWVAAYEVSTPMLPNLLVDIDATWERKRQAVSCYRSQLAFRPYAAVTEGLAVVRTLTLPATSRAEAFFVLSAQRLSRMSSRRWVALMGAPRALDPTVSRDVLAQGHHQGIADDPRRPPEGTVVAYR